MTSPKLTRSQNLELAIAQMHLAISSASDISHTEEIRKASVVCRKMEQQFSTVSLEPILLVDVFPNIATALAWDNAPALETHQARPDAQNFLD
ncbi:MAG: hypothetical protein KME11_05195 [Timaviella obliquedivisa GSE-PSE-MK23-08B]|jgi:hypothetical protein|nr:hypothetical protein [Timaviella obliquedivisa GSE-PSE-MK23-08B]